MGHWYYGRHFTLLAAGAVILFFVAQWNLLRDSLIGTFALNGALHALALVSTLRAPEVLSRKAAFIAIAIVLSVMSLYVGIIGLTLFAVLPGSERLYVVLGVCALSGAITYGSLVRLFWLRRLSSRLILSMAASCVLATLLAFLARTHAVWLGSWWLAAVWWFAFSGSLYFFDTHPDVLQRSKYNAANKGAPTWRDA